MSFFFGCGRNLLASFALGHALCVGSLCQTQATPSVAPSTSDVQANAPGLESLQKLIDQGASAEALQKVSVMTSQTPVPAGAYLVQGRAYYALNQFGNAEQAFARAVTQDPLDRESLQMQGLSLYRMGRPADAIPLLSKAQQWGPHTKVDPTYLLALCYVDTHRYDDARQAFALQYGFPPESARSYLLAARLLLRRDFVPIAEEFARKAIELDPQLPMTHGLLGEIALSRNHFDDALSEFQKEQERNPLEPGIYDRIGDAYIRAGKYQEANQWLQRAVLLEPTSTGPFILLGKVLLKQQQPANAAMYLEHAASMDANNYMTHGLLSQAYRAIGRSADATHESEISQKLQGASEPKLQGLQ